MFIAQKDGACDPILFVVYHETPAYWQTGIAHLIINNTMTVVLVFTASCFFIFV